MSQFLRNKHVGICVLYIAAVAAVPVLALSDLASTPDAEPKAPQMVGSEHADPGQAVPVHDGRSFYGATLRGDAPGVTERLPAPCYVVQDGCGDYTAYGPLRGGGWWTDGPIRRLVSAPVRFLFRGRRCR